MGDSLKGVFLSEEDDYTPLDYWKALLGLSCLGAVSTVGSTGFTRCPSSKWGWPLLSIELGSQCTYIHTLPTRHHYPHFSVEERDRKVTYLVECQICALEGSVPLPSPASVKPLSLPGRQAHLRPGDQNHLGNLFALPSQSLYPRDSSSAVPRWPRKSPL